MIRAEHPDRPLMNDVDLAKAGGNAEALDRGEGGEGDGAAAMVDHLVGHGEHELVVHRDGAREGEARRRGVAEHHGMLRGERPGGHRRPDRLTGRQSRKIGADPALFGEIGVRHAFRPQELHQGRALGHLLVVALEEEIIDPGALQRQGSGKRRGVDHDARALGQGLSAGHRRRRGRGGRGRRGGLGFGAGGGLKLGLRRDDEGLVGKVEDPRQEQEGDPISSVVLHGSRSGPVR